MKRQELYSKARLAVGKRREKALREAEQKRAALLEKAPELARLEQLQSEAGASAAALAAGGNHAEAQKKLKQMQEYAQQKEKLMRKMGYGEKDLQPGYHCKKCEDTGKVQGEVCECVIEEVKRQRREEINASGPLALCGFETFSLDYYPDSLPGTPVSPRQNMKRILEDCRYWAAEFGPYSESLYMFGDAGLGKTHLALALASEILEKGYDVLYMSAQSAFSAISADRYENENGLFGSMLEADLLVLDDLGTEYLDAYVLSRIYELVNGRSKKPTIYTTNIWRHEMLENRYTEKIASRLLGDCHPMRFFGQDIRLQKK